MKKTGVFVPIFINFKFSNIVGFTLHEFINFYSEKSLTIRFTFIIRIILLTIFMLVPYVEYLEEGFQKSSTTVKLLVLVCGVRVTGCIGVLASDLNNQIHLIQATKYLNNVDETLMKLGKHVSYKIYSRLLFVGCSWVFLCMVCSRVLLVILGQSIWTITMDFFVTGYPFLILSINTFYLMFFLFVIRRRFVSLMSLLRENRRNMMVSEDKELLETFLRITQMYTDLFNCAKSINKFVSFPSFICVMCNLLEGMLVANLMYQGEGSFQEVVLVVTYLWLTLCTLLSPMFVEEMPGKLCRLVAGIEILNTHKELKDAKNIFLYQALHTKIEFSVCGIFPMSMSSVPEQFAFCISLVLVMYQIAG